MIGKNRQKILNRIKAKKRRQAENNSRAKRKESYVPLIDRDPIAWLERQTSMMKKESSTARHYVRRFAADNMRLLRKKEEEAKRKEQ